jgi:hypothetical protein
MGEMGMTGNRYILQLLIFIMACLGANLLAGATYAADTKEDFYWNSKNYGRGVGTIPPGTCGDKSEDAGLCYEKCRSGYHGEGPVCWEDKAEAPSYPRGAGTVPSLHWVHSKLEPVCHGSKEKNGGLCYEKCRADYHGIGPVCWSSKALSYGRSAGTVPKLVCKQGQDQDAGLCYESCREGYRGLGPVCWGRAPAGYEVCGAGFAKNSRKCTVITASQASSVLTMFASVAAPEMEEIRKARQKQKMSDKELKAAKDLKQEMEPFAKAAKSALQPLKDFSKSAGDAVLDLHHAWKEFANDEELKKLKLILSTTDVGQSLSTGQDSDIDVLRDVAELVAALPLGDDPAANTVQDIFGVIAAYMYPTYGQ